MSEEYGRWMRRWLWVRSITFQVLLVLWVLMLSPPIVLSLVVPDSLARWRFNYAIARVWAAGALWLLRVICGIDYVVHGRAWLPSTASIVLMKHQSAWETIALFRMFPPLCWVLKKELMRVPVLGWCLKALRPIPIDRSRTRQSLQAVTDIGRQRLDDGTWVVIFPEGTRVAPGHSRRYRVGGASLAVASGRAVVPVAHNAGSYWCSGSMLKLPGTITVSIGKPIEPDGLTAEEVLAQTREWIEREQRVLQPNLDGPAEDTADEQAAKS